MITPDQLRKCAMCVYLAAEAGPAENISYHLTEAAKTIEAQTDEIDQLKAVIENLKEEITDKDYTIGSQAELKKLLQHITIQRDKAWEDLVELRTLIWEAVEIIEEVDLTPAYDGRGDCCYCGQRVGHDKDCERTKAAVLLPRLEAVKEGK